MEIVYSGDDFVGEIIERLGVVDHYTMIDDRELLGKARTRHYELFNIYKKLLKNLRVLHILRAFLAEFEYIGRTCDVWKNPRNLNICTDNYILFDDAMHKICRSMNQYSSGAISCTVRRRLEALQSLCMKNYGLDLK